MISTKNRPCRLTTAMGLDGGSVTRPILAVIVVTVVFYFGKNILLPLAMASILAVAFSPITSRLETFVGRFASAAWWSWWR
jgi:predicted PurR-regulated permease PerM